MPDEHTTQPASLPGLIEGRIVHVVLDVRFERNAGKHRAAIVSEVLDAKGVIYAEVILTPEDRMIINRPTSYSMVPEYSETKEPGTWHWIERT
jgi:hypothetical protein